MTYIIIMFDPDRDLKNLVKLMEETPFLPDNKNKVIHIIKDIINKYEPLAWTIDTDFLTTLIESEKFHDIIQLFGYIRKNAHQKVLRQFEKPRGNLTFPILQLMSMCYVDSNPNKYTLEFRNVDLGIPQDSLPDIILREDFDKVDFVPILADLKLHMSKFSNYKEDILEQIITHLTKGPTHNHKPTQCDAVFLLKLIDLLKHNDNSCYVKPSENAFYSLQRILYHLVNDTDKTASLAALINVCV